MGRLFDDNAADYVDLGDVTAARFLETEQWTLLAFFRIENHSGDERTIISKWDGSTGNQIRFRTDRQGPSPTNMEIYFDNAIKITGGNNVVVDTWYLLCVTCDAVGDNNSGKLYLVDMDGTFLDDGLGGSFAANEGLTAAIHIGARQANSDPMDGDIADVAYITNTTFTKDQISAYLRQPYRTAISFGTDLIFYHRLGQDSTTEPDWSGNGNDGTVVGSGSVIGANPPVGPLMGFDVYNRYEVAAAVAEANNRMLLLGVGI